MRGLGDGTDGMQIEAKSKAWLQEPGRVESGTGTW